MPHLLHMCVIFLIYFICFRFFYLLFSFLLKRFIVSKDLVSPVVTLKKSILCGFTCTKNTCEIKEFQPLSLTTSRTVLDFTGIFMLSGKQLFMFSTYNGFLQIKVDSLSKDGCYKCYLIK